MIDAGKVRALAIMDANPPALYPNAADAEGRARQQLADRAPGA